jgi:hypothetical protein
MMIYNNNDKQLIERIHRILPRYLSHHTGALHESDGRLILASSPFLSQNKFKCEKVSDTREPDSISSDSSAAG